MIILKQEFGEFFPVAPVDPGVLHGGCQRDVGGPSHDQLHSVHNEAVGGVGSSFPYIVDFVKRDTGPQPWKPIGNLLIKASAIWPIASEKNCPYLAIACTYC